MTKVYLKEVDLSSLEVENIDAVDYPEFVDAYFTKGEMLDGKPLSENELDNITENFPEILNEKAHEAYLEMS